MPKPRLNELAKQTLSALRSEGVELSDIDVITIYQLARRAIECAPQSALLMNTGKQVGNIEIFPLTLGAKMWLMTDVLEWFGNDELMIGLATVYAVAHARDVDKFIFKDGRTAEKKITAWSLRVNLTQDEIMVIEESFGASAVAQLSAGDVLKGIIEQIMLHPATLDLSAACSYIESIETEGENVPVLEYIAILQKNFYKERDHWLWKESDEFCMEMVRQARRMQATEGQADPFDPCTKAYRELKTYCENLKANHAR